MVVTHTDTYPCSYAWETQEINSSGPCDRNRQDKLCLVYSYASRQEDCTSLNLKLWFPEVSLCSHLWGHPDHWKGFRSVIWTLFTLLSFSSWACKNKNKFVCSFVFETNFIIFLPHFSLLQIKQHQVGLLGFFYCLLIGDVFIFLIGFVVSSRIFLIELICLQVWCLKWMLCSSCSSSRRPSSVVHTVCWLYMCHMSRSFSQQQGNSCSACGLW